MSLSISAVRGAISRAAGPSSSISSTGRPLPAASAKADALPDCRSEYRRVVVDEQFGCLVRDDRSRAAAIENEAGGELRPEDARFTDELQHLAGRPAVERRGLRGDQHKVSGEQGRTHQSGDAGWPVDDDVTGISRELGRLPMQRVAREADDAEEPRQAFLGALLGPIERRSLRVRVDQRDALALPSPGARQMQGQRGFAYATLLIGQCHDHCALMQFACRDTRVIPRGSIGGEAENESRQLRGV